MAFFVYEVVRVGFHLRSMFVYAPGTGRKQTYYANDKRRERLRKC